MSRCKAAQVAYDERGVTVLEYAMIAGLIALVIAAGVTAVGARINTAFSNAGIAVSATK